MKREVIDYQDHDVTLEGYAAYEDNGERKPLVLVCHDWSGKNEFAMKKAEQLAALGFVAFAVDNFGKGVLGKTKEEKSQLIAPFINDRKKLLTRLLAALDAAKTLPDVDVKKIAAIGFCFGGLCVLDLARSGTEIAGVVSFHGLFNPPPPALLAHQIKAKVLALHGFDDPMVPHDSIISFGKEMTAANASWEIDVYGHTMHAFTNPEANDPDFGTVYSSQVATRAWERMEQFFAEIF